MVMRAGAWEESDLILRSFVYKIENPLLQEFSSKNIWGGYHNSNPFHEIGFLPIS